MSAILNLDFKIRFINIKVNLIYSHQTSRANLLNFLPLLISFDSYFFNGQTGRYDIFPIKYAYGIGVSKVFGLL